MPFHFSPFGSEYAFRPAWNFWQRLYIRLFGFVDLPGRLRARIILPEVVTRCPRRILDFGSGTGCYSFYLSRDPGIKVCGVEVNLSRIRESNSILDHLERKNLTFLSGNGNGSLAHFPTSSFDLALTIEVLSCVPNIQGFLRECYRILKPEGYLLGHIPILEYLRPYEVNLFNDKEILELLEEAGFVNIRVMPTFNGMTRRVCHFYDKIAHSKLFLPLLFPWLLFISRCWQIKGTQGDYRFFTAQKPIRARK